MANSLKVKKNKLIQRIKILVKNNHAVEVALSDAAVVAYLINGTEKILILHHNCVEKIFAFGRHHPVPSIFDRISASAGTCTIEKIK